MTLSRIFDNNPKNHTIHSLVNRTLGNIGLFSAAALEARKARGDSPPSLLGDYMAHVWVPLSEKSLQHLKEALTPFKTRFENIYRPIRHAIFAHRIMSDDESAVRLFGVTNRIEVGEIVDFLHDLIDVIADLYTNGTEPVLGKRDFQESNQHVRDSVGVVLKRL